MQQSLRSIKCASYNCKSLTNVCLQVLGKVPTISIDKTDGCQMFLSPESLNVELITSKSSEMNVMIPKANGDYVSVSLRLSYFTILIIECVEK